MWLSTALTLALAAAGVPADMPAQDTLRASQLSAGGRNTCAVTELGVTYCWGANDQGQVGDGTRTTESRNVPTRVVTEGSFTGMAIGGRFTCGLTAEGDAICWGYNRDGQLGNGTTEGGLTPSFVKAPVPLGQSALGRGHACALGADDSTYCWGNNNNGQVGDGQSLSRRSYHATPVVVSGGHTFQQVVVVGEKASCGLTTSGQPYCWGLVDLVDWKAKPTTSPVLVAEEMVFEQLAAGSDHLCGLNDGRAYCWGENRSGQLGDSTNSRRSTPTPVATDRVFIRLTAGSAFTCGLTDAGQAWCWGANRSGQLGSGKGSYGGQGWNTPKPVFGEITFRTLVAGDDHTCGLAVDATVYCWGENNVGQLGTGSRGWSNIPKAVVLVP